MTLQSWLLFMTLSIIPAVSPGPGVMLAISNTLRYGRNATLVAALGNALGLVILGYASVLGFGALMATSALAFTVLKLIGAAYLVYLGIRIWRDRTTIEEAEQPSQRRSMRKGSLFFQALLVSLTNPKAMLIISALFPQFMGRDGFTWQQASLLAFSYAGLCYANHAAIAFAGNSLRRFLMSRSRLTAVRRVLGSMFIGFGAALAAASR